MQYRFTKPVALERKTYQCGEIVDEAVLQCFNVKNMLRCGQIEIYEPPAEPALPASPAASPPVSEPGKHHHKK